MDKIEKLNLTNYRSYAHLKLDTEGAKNVVITGPNGVGKTNILEAVSMLSANGPFRKARTQQLGLIGGTPQVFTIFAKIGDDTLGLSCDYSTEGGVKEIVANSEEIQAGDMADIVKIVWITPFMDRLFSEAGAERRRFLDNLIANFFPAYGEHLNTYTKLLQERARVLKSPRPDARWLDSIEAGVAALGVAIAAMRLDFEEKQNAALERSRAHFPSIRISIGGLVEDRLRIGKAADAEEMFRTNLLEGRELFTKSYSPPVDGVHRSDFTARNLDKNISADQTSTGEQKLAVLSIVLAYAEMLGAYFGRMPIVLLDEAPAHLDDDKARKLYEALEAMPAQVWLTGINEADFAFFKDKNATFFRRG